MIDEGPVSFEVHGDLGSMQVQVRGGSAGDIIVMTLQNLIGPIYPLACWFVVRTFLSADPPPHALGGLLLVAGFALCVLGMVGAAWSLLVPHYLEWRVAGATLLAIVIGAIGFASGAPGLEQWGPPLLLWLDAVVATVRNGVRLASPTSVSVDAHGVTVDGVRAPLDGLAVGVDHEDLCIGTLRIPMGAHAPWEREWLSERITRARDNAQHGPQRVEDRKELERLLGGRQAQ